ncbi:MAG: O-antigen ligase family protein [Flavobacterium sp.]|nr:O-antigen ligase family protein [Flavobacterium sp.]
MSKAKQCIAFLFIAILLLDIYLFSFRINIIIQLSFIAFLYFSSGIKLVPVSFIRLLLPLFAVLLIGFIGSMLHKYTLGDIIKDLLHIIKPIAGITIGYFVFRIIDDYRIFIKIIIVTGLVTALIHLGSIFLFTNFLGSDISAIRGKYFLDNFLEIFAFIMLVFSPKEFEMPLFEKKVYNKVILAVLTVSILLYFSRSMFVVIIIMALSSYGFTRINGKSLKIIGVLLITVFLFYGYLFSIKLNRESKGIEGFMYKIKNAPSEIFNASIDRENHQDLWDHWRGYEAKRAFALMHDNPSSYIFGAGHGSLVNLKFVAPLGDGDGMKYISSLHNGYVFIFYKTGVLGLFFLLTFLLRLYMFLYRKQVSPTHKFVLNVISTIGIFYLFSTVIITGIYIPKDSVILILGGLLFFERKMRMVAPINEAI